MKILSIDALWKPGPKNAVATSAELKKADFSWSEKRAELFQEHEQLSKSKIEVFESGGALAVKANQQRMRDIEDELEICDISLKDLRGRIEQVSAQESKVKLEGDAKQAALDVEAKHDLGLKFLNLLDEAFEVSKEYSLKTRAVTTFIQAAAKAGRVDLKPAPDPIAAAFLRRGQIHPIDDPVLIQSITIAVSQKNLLKKLGVEI